ncbi:MAG: hypothetical protein HQK93_08090 [Nitrospirae bacterium]|nr:hypothetical protein [Nitrospirota bacterium]
MTIQEEAYRRMSRNVLLGSFLGGLVGATIALIVLTQSPEEKRRNIAELQKDLVKPVKAKFFELVEHVGDTLKKAIDESAKAATSTSTSTSTNPDTEMD